MTKFMRVMNINPVQYVLSTNITFKESLNGNLYIDYFGILKSDIDLEILDIFLENEGLEALDDVDILALRNHDKYEEFPVDLQLWLLLQDRER